MPIFFNSFVVVLSQNGIVKKWHRPMDADNAVKIYTQYQQDANKNIEDKIILPNITMMVGDLSNKFIERLAKTWNGDLHMVGMFLLGINYVSEYGPTKIQIVHSSQT